MKTFYEKFTVILYLDAIRRSPDNALINSLLILYLAIILLLNPTENSRKEISWANRITGQMPYLVYVAWKETFEFERVDMLWSEHNTPVSSDVQTERL